MGYFGAHPAIGVFCTLALLGASALLLAAPQFDRRIGRYYVHSVVSFFLVTRVGLLLVIIRFLGRASGPDRDYWVLQGMSALKGLSPYVDFNCQYGPLFPYLLAPAFALFDSYVAPVTVFILFDLLAFMLLHRATKNAELSRRAATLYLMTPLSWFIIVRHGQDESVGAFFVVVLLILAARRSEYVLGLVAGLATALTKVLFLLPALPILLGTSRRWRACAIAAAVLACCYLPFVARGGDILQWIPGARGIYGPSIWALLRWVLTVDVRSASIATGAVLASLTALVILRVNRMGAVNAVLTLYSGLMILSPKACHPYVLLVLPLLCLRVASSGRRSELLLFSFYSFLMPLYFDLSVGTLHHPYSVRWFLSLGSACGIIAYHVYLLVISIRTAFVDRHPPFAAAPDSR